MINTLTIKNFRSITRLDLKGLKKINFLTGKNNCGKTSVLEALFILLGMGNPTLPVNIHHFRDLLLSEDEDFRFLFNSLNFANKPEISGQFEDHKRTLKLEPLFVQYTGKMNDVEIDESSTTRKKNISQSTTGNLEVINGLKLNAFINQKKVSNGEISIKRGVQKLNNNYLEKQIGRFISPSTIFTGLDKKLESIIINKEMDNYKSSYH